MTAITRLGKIEFHCDGCGETFETDAEDWLEALYAFRCTRWQAIQIDGKREHWCEDCEPDIPPDQ